MKLPADWSEFIASLISHEVRFVIVGAHALAASGRPRATQDIDFFVEPNTENARRLGNALADFGFEAGSTTNAWHRGAARPKHRHERTWGSTNGH